MAGQPSSTSQTARGGTRLVIALGVLVWFAVEAPLVGRPVEWPFTGAVAGFVRTPAGFIAPFAMRVEASPQIVQADEAITLRVTVMAWGKVISPPSRLDLRQVSAFERSFHVEDGDLVKTESDGERGDDTPRFAGERGVLPPRFSVESECDGQSGLRVVSCWFYRLRPKGTHVREVPSVPFLFYNPHLLPPDRGYQLLFSDAIPLTVRPAEKVGVPPDFPEEVTEPATGAGLTARHVLWRVGPRTVLVALLGPPLGCVGWYAVWRRLYPDAARAARLRRGRAARIALDALARVGGDDRTHADAIIAVLSNYLRMRFETTSSTLTPDEAADVLHRAGLDSYGVALREVWRRADEIRFAAVPRGRVALGEVRRLIMDMEEAAWSPSLR